MSKGGRAPSLGQVTQMAANKCWFSSLLKNAPNTKILKETFVGLGFGFAQNLASCLFLCVFSLVLTDFYSEESTFVEEASQCTRESRWHVVCLASCSMQK